MKVIPLKLNKNMNKELNKKDFKFRGNTALQFDVINQGLKKLSKDLKKDDKRKSSRSSKVVQL